MGNCCAFFKARREPEKPKKKEKPKKEKKPAVASSNDGADAIVDVGRLDMRVGLIRTAKKHPDADALYFEEVDVGEEKPKTVLVSSEDLPNEILWEILSYLDNKTKLNVSLVNLRWFQIINSQIEGLESIRT